LMILPRSFWSGFWTSSKRLSALSRGCSLTNALESS
jgi:hypothetical protein